MHPKMCRISLRRRLRHKTGVTPTDLNTPTLNTVVFTVTERLIVFLQCMNVWISVCACAPTAYYSSPTRQNLFLCTNYTWGPLDGIKISFFLTCIKFVFLFFFLRTCRIFVEFVNTLIDCTGDERLIQQPKRQYCAWFNVLIGLY